MSDKEKIIQTEATEQTAEPVEERSEESDQALPELIATLRTQYEDQIATLNAKHAKDVAERDAVIAQLLSDNKPAHTETIAERINAKRKYKKW